jgi:hypothetical protein
MVNIRECLEAAICRLNKVDQALGFQPQRWREQSELRAIVGSLTKLAMKFRWVDRSRHGREEATEGRMI